jgi:hypothetical protein
MVEDGFKKLEAIPNLVQEPITSSAQFVAFYIQQTATPTFSGLQRILELKVMQ